MILLGLIIWILVVLILGSVRSRLPFSLSVIGLMLVICSAPIVTVERISRHRVVRVIAETLIAVAAITLFVWTELGLRLQARWLLLTAGVLLVLEIGGHLVEWNKDDSISQLSQWSEIFVPLQTDAVIIDKIFRRQQFTYLSIPVGFLLGLHVGLVFGYSDRRTALACLIAIVSLASLLLTYFLIVSFIRMIQPILTTELVSSPAFEAVAPSGKALPLLGTQFVIIMPPPADDDGPIVNLSGAATVLRKIYLFDSLHSVLLLVAFVSISLNLFDVQISLARVVGLLVISTFVFSQLPFAIGQSRLRRKILWPVRESKKVELSKKLGRAAPSFPAFQLLNSLATTGTGSLLYFLLDETVKDRLKQII
jgi:hypothetical protein